MSVSSVSSGSAEDKASETMEIYGYTGERQFEGKLQIITQGFPVSRNLSLYYLCGGRKDHPLCKNCPFNRQEALEVHFELENLDALHASALALYADRNDPRLVLGALADTLSKEGNDKALFYMCAARSKGLKFAGKNELAVTPCLVTSREGDTAPAWFACNLEKSPAWMLARGKLSAGDRGRIGILVTEFTPDTEIAPPLESELQAARSKLAEASVKFKDTGVEEGFLWHIADLLRKKSNLKGDEVTKGYAADLLTASSPVWVRTPEAADAKMLGATTAEIGPTTTAKSVRERFYLIWLGCGGYIRGKISESGLGGGVEYTEGIGWGVKKGALARFDLSLLVVDNLPPSTLDNYIESRRDGIIMVTKIRSTEFWARTRLKLLANPQVPLDECMYKCLALKMYDPKVIARFAFAIATDAVSSDERYKSELETISDEEEDLLKALRIVLHGNLARETTFTVPPDLWPKIMEYGKILEDAYGCEDVPLYVRALPYKLSLLTYCFALIRGAEHPSEEDVKSAYEWLDYCAKDLELDAYAQVWRDMHQLSEEEFRKLAIKLENKLKEENPHDIYDTVTYHFIDYLAKNGQAHLGEIVAYIETIDGGAGEDAVKQRAKFLKGNGVLKSGKEGYTFSARGVRFFRRWYAERAQATLQGRAEP